MKKLHELLPDLDVNALASRSHGRLGKQMASAGAVAVQERGPFMLEARVSFRNGQVQTVRFDATSKGLRYSCSCTARKGNFCSHLAAATLFLQAEDSVPLS